MASSQKVKSGTEQKVELWIELKEKVDLVYKQLNQYRGACRSVDRLNRAVRRTGGQLDPDRILAEFVKFGRDYRVSRKRIRKLDRQLLAVNLYDKLYDLYESLVMGESTGTGGDLIDSSAIDEEVVDCNGPVGTDDASVDDFAGISIDPDTPIDVEMDLMEDACLEPRQSATLNHSLNKSSTDLSQLSSILVADVSASTRVTRQQIQRISTDGFVSRKMKKDEASIDSSAIVVCGIGSVGIEDNSVNGIVGTERPFHCPQCDKSFKTSSHLSVHKRTHENEPRFNCSWEGCDYVTYYSEHLKARQTVHTGKHRFKCSWEGCDYGTNYSHSLKDHQAVHTGERSFQCPQCDKSFKYSSGLNRHKRTHSSEPRFKCKWKGCDYGSHQLVHLTKHQNRHIANQN